MQFSHLHRICSCSRNGPRAGRRPPARSATSWSESNDIWRHRRGLPTRPRKPACWRRGANEPRLPAAPGARVAFHARFLGRRLKGTQVDFTDARRPARAVGELADRLGGLDVLVNNAGIAGPTARCEDIDPEAWTRTLAVNITGQFYCAQFAIPRGDGRRSPLPFGLRPGKHRISAAM